VQLKYLEIWPEILLEAGLAKFARNVLSCKEYQTLVHTHTYWEELRLAPVLQATVVRIRKLRCNCCLVRFCRVGLFRIVVPLLPDKVLELWAEQASLD